MEEKDKFGREMHKVKCSECGQETTVPFAPDGQRPVYCRDCFMKKKDARGGGNRFGGGGRSFSGSSRGPRRDYQKKESSESGEEEY